MDRLYDLPQFADDYYIQSLRSYTSLFWSLLRDITALAGGRPNLTELSVIFLTFHLISRTLCFVGFLLCGSLLGVTGKRERFIFAGLLSITTLLRGHSAAGGGGLFLTVFTHSEIANGLTLISIYLAMRSLFALSWAVNGVTFCINFFIAAWNAVPLILILTLRILEKKVRFRHAVVSTAIGSGLFLMSTLPIVYWVLQSPDATQGGSFDYVAYLRAFAPIHFLFTGIGLGAILKLATVVAIGYLAFWKVRVDRGTWLATFSGFTFVYLFGIALPYLTHSKLFLNFHLLRVSGTIHLLATLAVLTVASFWLLSSDSLRAYIFGPALVFSCCSSKYMLLLAVVILLVSGVVPERIASFARGSRRTLQGVRLLCLASTAVFTMAASIQSYHEIARERQVLGAWASLGSWIQKHTPTTSIFLLPYRDLLEDTHAGGTDNRLSLTSIEFSFETLALRQGWVEAKSGAAVMWASSYYNIWAPRMAEIKSLNTMAQKTDYAQQHGIGYVVTTCNSALDGGRTPIYRNTIACLYDVRR